MKKIVSLMLAMLMLLAFAPAVSAATVAIDGSHDVTIYSMDNNQPDYGQILASLKKTNMPATLSIKKAYDELGKSEGGRYEGTVALTEVHVTMNEDFSGADASVKINGKDAVLVATDKVVFNATMPENGGTTTYKVEASKPHASGDGKVTETFSFAISYTNTQKGAGALLVSPAAPAGADYSVYVVGGKLYIDFENQITNCDVEFTFADSTGKKFTSVAYAAASSGVVNATEKKLVDSKATFQINGDKIKFTVDTMNAKFTSVEIPVVTRANVKPQDPRGIYFLERIATIKIGQVFTPKVAALNGAPINYTLSVGNSNLRPVVADGKTIVGLEAGETYITASCTVGGNTYTDTMKVVVLGEVIENPSVAYITASTLNVRKGAGTSYARIGTLNRGAKVNVLSVAGGWAKIEFNGGVGYISASYLGYDAPTAASYKVTCRTLNVRSGPATSYSRIGNIYRGNAVEVVSISNGWAQIKWNNGTAYVAANYLSK